MARVAHLASAGGTSPGSGRRRWSGCRGSCRGRAGQARLQAEPLEGSVCVRHRSSWKPILGAKARPIEQALCPWPDTRWPDRPSPGAWSPRSGESSGRSLATSWRDSNHSGEEIATVQRTRKKARTRRAEPQGMVLLSHGCGLRRLAPPGRNSPHASGAGRRTRQRYCC